MNCAKSCKRIMSSNQASYLEQTKERDQGRNVQLFSSKPKSLNSSSHYVSIDQKPTKEYIALK